MFATAKLPAHGMPTCTKNARQLCTALATHRTNTNCTILSACHHMQQRRGKSTNTKIPKGQQLNCYGPQQPQTHAQIHALVVEWLPHQHLARFNAVGHGPGLPLAWCRLDHTACGLAASNAGLGDDAGAGNSCGCHGDQLNCVESVVVP